MSHATARREPHQPCEHAGQIIRIQSAARSNVNGYAIRIVGWAADLGVHHQTPAMIAYSVRMDRAGIAEDKRRPLYGHLRGDRGHAGLGYCIDEREVGGVVDLLG